MIRDDVGLRQPKEFQELMKALERHEDCVIDLVTQFDVVEGGDVCVWAIGGRLSTGGSGHETNEHVAIVAGAHCCAP